MIIFYIFNKRYIIMNDCKDCNCKMKSAFNKNKNIFCKKNFNNFRFLLPLEFAFYLGSLSIFTYYNYNKLKNANILITPLNI